MFVVLQTSAGAHGHSARESRVGSDPVLGYSGP